MKAVVCTKYGPPEVLQIQEVRKPAPKPHDVLVKIHATTAHVGDVRIRGFNVPRSQWLLARLFLGLRRPRNSILGMEFAGEVEAVGEQANGFARGDQVFGFAGFSFGAYAEYICVPANGGGSKHGYLAPKPKGMTFGQAAPIAGGGVTALLILRTANIQEGQSVLVYGASGSLGTFAVQLARHFGAKVTGVCSGTNLALVRGLGAEHVIDYTKADFAEQGQRYDVVFDAVDKLPVSHAKKCVKKGGVYLNAVRSSSGLKPDAEGLMFLKGLVENDELRTVIDRSYAMEEIVEAHRYVERGHKIGNVIIDVAG